VRGARVRGSSEEALVKQKHFIDTHKGLTPLVVLLFMALYGCWDSATAWVYLALHGTYGVLWVLKSLTFPDRSWERPTGPGYALVLWTGLSLYWIAPFLITSRGTQVAPWMLGVCTALWGLGVFWHFGADMQKHTTLELRPGLLTTGLWSRTRNPNYLGELLIYLSFALLAEHWLPLVVLGVFLGAVWLPNMLRKDRSLARYPEFEAYARRSGLLLPSLSLTRSRPDPEPDTR